MAAGWAGDAAARATAARAAVGPAASEELWRVCCGECNLQHTGEAVVALAAAL